MSLILKTCGCIFLSLFSVVFLVWFPVTMKKHKGQRQLGIGIYLFQYTLTSKRPSLRDLRIRGQRRNLEEETKP